MLFHEVRCPITHPLSLLNLLIKVDLVVEMQVQAITEEEEDITVQDLGIEAE